MAKENFSCEHEKFYYKNFKIKPFEDLDEKYKLIFSFFLYDVEQWKNNEIVLTEKWEEVFEEIIKELNVDYKQDYSEKSSGKYKEVGLDEDTMCFECQRICISKTPKEDVLSSFLRHIRNSIAHGQVYVKDNNYVLLQDLDDKKHITARILIHMDSLSKLKEYIENLINKNYSQD